MWLGDNFLFSRKQAGTKKHAALHAAIAAWCVWLIVAGAWITVAGSYGAIAGIISDYAVTPGRSFSCADNSS